jgi:hypothetical protein
MNESALHLVDSLVQEREKKIDNIYNRRNFIDLNNFFKNSGKIEVNGRFVAACRYVLPIPNVRPVKNDMSKYKLIKRYESRN